MMPILQIVMERAKQLATHAGVTSTYRASIGNAPTRTPGYRGARADLVILLKKIQDLQYQVAFMLGSLRLRAPSTLQLR